MPKKQQEQWLHEADPWIYFVYSHNFVDFDAFDDQEPLKQAVAIERIDKELLDKVIELESDLLLHEASFSDELIDPFGQSQNTQHYISSSFRESTSTDLASYDKKISKHALFILDLKVRLDGYLQIESRVRYSYWDLLADVGGFNDGCLLLCSIFMSFYSSLVF